MDANQIVDDAVKKIGAVTDANGVRLSSGISHIFGGFLIFLPVAILLGISSGCLAVIIWYWSREKCEHEFRVMGKGTTASVWTRGMFPWQWGRHREPDSLYDWALPAAVYGLVWVTHPYFVPHVMQFVQREVAYVR